MSFDRLASRRVQRVAALTYASLMGLIAVFQSAAAAGAPVGEYTQGGQLPGRLSPVRRCAAAASAVLVVVFGAGVLAMQDMGPMRRAQSRTLRVLRRATLVYGTVAVPMNLASRSVKERCVWGPTTIVALAARLLAQPRQP